MSRTDLINEFIALSFEKSKDITKKSATETIDILFKAMENVIVKNDKLSIIGFGTFSVVDREEKKGRNPQTGKEMTIPASRAAKFKPGINLKDAVNKKKVKK